MSHGRPALAALLLTLATSVRPAAGRGMAVTSTGNIFAPDDVNLPPWHGQETRRVPLLNTQDQYLAVVKMVGPFHPVLDACYIFVPCPGPAASIQHGVIDYYRVHNSCWNIVRGLRPNRLGAVGTSRFHCA